MTILSNVPDDITRTIPGALNLLWIIQKPLILTLCSFHKLQACEVEDVNSHLDSTKLIGPNSLAIKSLKVLKPCISQHLKKLEKSIIFRRAFSI